MEEFICDADLKYLGRTYFFSIRDSLCREKYPYIKTKTRLNGI